MPRKLKVIGGNWCGTHRVVMACHSLEEFRKTTGISRDYASETWNDEELRVANAEPGEVFGQSVQRHGRPWFKMKRHDGCLVVPSEHR